MTELTSSRPRTSSQTWSRDGGEHESSSGKDEKDVYTAAEDCNELLYLCDTQWLDMCSGNNGAGKLHPSLRGSSHTLELEEKAAAGESALSSPMSSTTSLPSPTYQRRGRFIIWPAVGQPRPPSPCASVVGPVQ
jgi:hypothetical protein